MKSALTFSALSMFLAFGCAAPTGESEIESDADNVETDSVSQAQNAPTVCSFQTINGRYLGAVGGGGRTTDVLHTDATRVGSWEKFTLVDPGEGSPIPYGFMTKTGHYLSAVGGGGRITDVMHSDAASYNAWERLTLVSQGGGYYAIQTVDGHYLTAVGGGGRITDTIHSDATRIGAWEKFRVTCGLR